MPAKLKMDSVTIDGTQYVYRNRYWMTPNGYCVSTAHAQMLTRLFYEKNGRIPGNVPVVPPPPTAPVRTPRRRAAV